jgi:hypothetical protein
MKRNEFPFEECDKCRTLTDCPCPDIKEGEMSLPMIPDCCPRPMEIMAATLKVHKVNHKLIKEN